MEAAMSDSIPTAYTREALLDALTNEVSLPVTEVAAATLRAREIEPAVVELIEREQHHELDPGQIRHR
jgi:hypothetical protein